MALESVLIVTDRPGQASSLVSAFEGVMPCVVVGPDVAWGDVDRPGCIVTDIDLAMPMATRCMLSLGLHYGAAKPYVIGLLGNMGQDGLRRARTLGVNSCLSALTSPRSVVSNVVSRTQASPGIVERVVKQGVQRTGQTITSMLDMARDGSRFDAQVIQAGVDPVISAVREGGLARWLDCVWVHDDATYQHCLLVAGLAATFAVHMGFGQQDRRRFAMAAIVHDVGKARIPLAILNKPGKLDPGEAAVMKTHAAIGHDILQRGGVQDAVILAATRHHHEMLDGSGYPDALSSDSISDVVRLLTVCDIYAALIERRPYRDPMPAREAIGVLASMGDRIEQGFVSSFADAVLAVPQARAA